MEAIDLLEVIDTMTEKIEEMKTNSELEPEDELTLIQPLANEQVVIVIGNSDGIKVTTTNFGRILPKINKSLNIYNTSVMKIPSPI